MSARVAVLVPCYGDGPLTAEAVASVSESEPVEIVVVDDLSTDPETLATLERLEAEGISVIRHRENRGTSQARMTGLAATSAPYVFPLDSDDLAVPGSLGTMADRLDADPEAAACFGDYVEFGDWEMRRKVPDWLDPFRLAYTNEFPISSMFRRTWLDRVGGWHSGGYKERSYEDWSLWMGLVEAGGRGIHAGPDVTVYRRRLHGMRNLHVGKSRHPHLYAQLQKAHPGIFGDNIPRHRAQSDLPLHRKLLYPFVYGGRRRFPAEAKLKAALDRARIWTNRAD